MRHPDKIEKYNGTIDELAKDITNLRYDILAQLLDKLSHNLLIDAQNDFDKGRKQLYEQLYKSSLFTSNACLTINDAWKICKKYMQ